MDIKDLLERVNMLSFVHSLGYTEKDKEKSTHLWHVLKNPTTGAKALIPPSNNKAQIVGLNQGMRNPINFYIDHKAHSEVFSVDKSQYKEAIEYVKSFIGIGHQYQMASTPTVSKPLVSGKKSESDLLKVHNYSPINFYNPKHTQYFERRNLILDDAFVEKFQNDLFISEKVINGYKLYNPVFLKVDISGEISGLVKRYFDRDGNSKKIVDGAGFWHSKIDKNTTYDSIIVVESQIDALSHFQLKGAKGDNLYVSSDGQLTQSKMDFIFETMPQKISDITGSKPNEVVLAFDNDFAGLYFTAMCIDRIAYSNLHPRLVNDVLYLNDVGYSANDTEQIREKLDYYALADNRNFALALDLPENKDWNMDLSELVRVSQSRSR